MAAIPMGMRVRIYEARMSGETTDEVADRFGVSPAFVRRLMQRHRETKSLAPLAGRRGPKPKLAGHRDRLRRYVAGHPDRTPAEVAAALRLKVSALTVWRALRALGLTFKKSRSTPPSGTGRT